MADSSEIDTALVAKLGADPELMRLMVHGAYFDEAPARSTRHVIVSIVDAHDEPKFGEGARAYEDVIYQVKAVGLSVVQGDTDPWGQPAVPLPPGVMKAAAARIEALLNGGDLTITGYQLLVMRRVGRVRMTQTERDDPSIRWHHRGGRYQVMARAT